MRDRTVAIWSQCEPRFPFGYGAENSPLHLRIEDIDMRLYIASLLILGFAPPLLAQGGPLECTNWQQQHPEWIWCDDFETDSALEQNYFEVDRQGGRFGVVNSTAFGGTSSLRGSYQTGVQDAGNIKLSFGKTPVAPTRFTSENFNDVYWRVYMKTSSNWVGNPIKLSRATIFVASNWSQAAIGHVWEDSENGVSLGLDPASGVSGSTVVTTKYNDFDHLTWLGKRNATVPVFGPTYRDKWVCIEARMKLNTPGSSDGEMSLWIDEKLDAQSSNLNFRGSYTTYGINALMLENYVNAGAPQNQQRYFDNFVVSRSRIGCQATGKMPNPPTDVNAQ